MASLLEKFSHPIPQIRERAVAALHSKVLSSELVKIDELPVSAFADALAAIVHPSKAADVSADCIDQALMLVAALSAAGGLNELKER